ncbi:MAG TPA: NEW3 domain-containing protein [bacterium]|nr:NEW3 domain-containing protein [bacterium]
MELIKSAWKRVAVAMIVFVALFGMGAIVATSAATTNKATTLSKETQLKLLKLEEAKVSLKTAQDMYEDALKDLKDMEELYQEDVVTGKEVSEAETDQKDTSRNLELAKIDLAKTALNFLQDVTHISIVDAYQYIDADNNRHMAIELLNDSDLDLALIGLGEGVPEANIKSEDVPGLLTIENLFVSVRSGSTNIGDPFEIKVNKLKLNKAIGLDFKLNSPADEVSLSLKYHNAEELHNIYLQKKSTEDIVRVSSLQFAQEGQLGGSVDFGIELERLAENEKTFSLGVLELPDKYLYKFTDKGNQLSRVKFSQGTTKHSLTLKITVPDKLPDEELKVPVRFYAIIGEDEALDQLEEMALKGKVKAEDLDALKVGYEKLELTPRGTGEFEISLTTLYYEIKTDESIAAKMTVENTGSVRLDDIRFDIEKPYEWDVKLNPEEIKSIEPRKELEIEVSIMPPEDVEVGAYEVKIEGSTDYEGGTVKTDQKNLRIQVSAKTNLTLSIAIALGLFLVIIVMAIVFIKLSRR